MKDALEFWRFRKRLTVREATCLAFGFAPSDWPEGEPLPKGWSGLFTALAESINSDIAQYRSWNDSQGNVTEKTPWRSYPCPELIFYDISTLSEASTFKVECFRKWFKIKGLKPHFFYPENQENKMIVSGEGGLFKVEQEQQAKLPSKGVQGKREEVLTRLIKKRGLGYLRPLGHLGVWQELTKENTDRFPPRDKRDETIKKFFLQQNQITFKRGR